MRPLRRKPGRWTHAAISCQQIIEAISARSDGEPAGVADQLVDRHLADCETCQAFARACRGGTGELTRLTRQLTLRPPKSVPDDLHRSLIAIAATQHPPTTRRRPQRPRRQTLSHTGAWLAAALPVVAAIGLLGVPSTHHAPTHRPSPCTTHLHHPLDP